MAHAVCGNFCSPQARFGQVTSVGALVFHCARRERVLLREVFLFGTATVLLLTVRAGFGGEGAQCRPARIDCIVCVSCAKLVEALPAFGA